jgi:hypothetical protein
MSSFEWFVIGFVVGVMVMAAAATQIVRVCIWRNDDVAHR